MRLRTQSFVPGSEDALLQLAGQMVDLQVRAHYCQLCAISRANGAIILSAAAISQANGGPAGACSLLSAVCVRAFMRLHCYVCERVYMLHEHAIVMPGCQGEQECVRVRVCVRAHVRLGGVRACMHACKRQFQRYVSSFLECLWACKAVCVIGPSAFEQLGPGATYRQPPNYAMHTQTC